jgi:hypothetical protein
VLVLRQVDLYLRQRLTINIIDALNSTSATAALSAKQGSILKGLVDSKANATGDNSIAFNVAVATSDMTLRFYQLPRQKHENYYLQ